jgi:hypothetical protein
MKNNHWKQGFTHVIIGAKCMWFYWELWSELRVFEDESEFIEKVKEKYRKKFGKRSFYIRPVYSSNTKYQVQ